MSDHDDVGAPKASDCRYWAEKMNRAAVAYEELGGPIEAIDNCRALAATLEGAADVIEARDAAAERARGALVRLLRRVAPDVPGHCRFGRTQAPRIEDIQQARAALTSSAPGRLVSADDVVRVLNEALALDRAAITDLATHRTLINRELAESNLVVCSTDFKTGLLGILNGLFGLACTAGGQIASEWDSLNGLVRFSRLASPPPEENAADEVEP